MAIIMMLAMYVYSCNSYVANIHGFIVSISMQDPESDRLQFV